MAIEIVIYNGKWQVKIGKDSSREIWQFETTKEFSEALEQLLIIKEKYGKFQDLK